MPTFAPIGSREELVFLLSMGAELEHGLACLYLFTAFSLKRDLAEGGMTEDQLKLAKRWRRTIADVAIQEMLHLAQVNNLLTAVGGAPHFLRPNFPQPASAYPFGMALTLEPFNERTTRRLACFELPEDLSPERRATFEPMCAEFVSLATDDDEGAPESGLEPYPIDFRTVGEFYHKVEAAFRTMPEDHLFIGPPDAQASGSYLDFAQELVPVVDRVSAIAGIEMIVLQGEGAREDSPDSHFARFDAMRRDYLAEIERSRAMGLAFAPSRPVVPNPITRHHRDAVGGSVIVDPTTHRVAEVFNVAYEALLHTLMRFFAHEDETEEELRRLGVVSLSLMTEVVGPLGEALARMPFGGADHAGMTAGASFGFTRDMEMLPHKRAAWLFIRELLEGMRDPAAELAALAGAPLELGRARDAISKLAREFPSL